MVDLDATAQRARYDPSPYHCQGTNKPLLPRARLDPPASKCDAKWTLAAALEALKAGIRCGWVSEAWQGDFPRLVWYKDGPVVYEARLSEREQGAYHGYPIEEEEWPRGLCDA